MLKEGCRCQLYIFPVGRGKIYNKRCFNLPGSLCQYNQSLIKVYRPGDRQLRRSLPILNNRSKNSSFINTELCSKFFNNTGFLSPKNNNGEVNISGSPESDTESLYFSLYGISDIQHSHHTGDAACQPDKNI